MAAAFGNRRFKCASAGLVVMRDCAARLITPTTIRAKMPALRLGTLLNLAAARREHQSDKFLRDSRFEPLSVTFVDPHGIGDDAAVLAFRINKHFRGAGSGQQPPAFAARILPTAIEDVTLFRVDDFAL